MLIRQATCEDFSALRSIEIAAFETLRAVNAVSGAASASSDAEFHQYLKDGLLYAACDPANAPVGYGGGMIMERWLHIGELDVHPDWQRKGLGRRLVQTLLDEGRSRSLQGATLTTDRRAAFNAPFYASIGFQIVEGDKCSPRLKAILDREAQNRLDPLRRVGMMLVF
jgi:predicted N-acetyltransferase YhbS